MASELIPRVLACNQATDFRLVKRAEPCPWCGRPWEDHDEAYELEEWFRNNIDSGPDSDKPGEPRSA